jgi:hypothetical protein
MYLEPNSIVHRMSRDTPPELAVMFNPIGGLSWAVNIPQLKQGRTIACSDPDSAGLRPSSPRTGGRRPHHRHGTLAR